MKKETREKIKSVENLVLQGMKAHNAIKEVRLGAGTWSKYYNRKKSLLQKKDYEGKTFGEKAVVIICDVSKLKDVINKL